MRTTVRLRGELLEAAKRKAAEQGRSLTALIEDAVRHELARPAKRERVEIPISKATGGPLPGVDLIKTNALEDDLDRTRRKS
jgi:hypothetical protein